MTDLFKPAFDFNDTAQSTLLKEGKAEFSYKDKNYKGNSCAKLEFQPTQRISFNTNLDNPALVHMSCDDVAFLRFEDDLIDGFSTQISFNYGKGTTIKWCPKKTPLQALGNDKTEIEYLLIHLFNFPDYLSIDDCEMQRHENGTTRINRINLKGSTLHIEIKSLLETMERTDKLRSIGGFQLTHVAVIRNSQGKHFSGKEARNALRVMQLFLSFAKGDWSPAVCPVGFAANGERVWEQWSIPKTNQYEPISWFGIQSTDQLTRLFPLFELLCQHEGWRTALHEVIYWYLNANDPNRGIDTGIILTQSALERLSFEFSVRERQLLLTKGFKDLWASDKFRLLFSSLGIPLEIPPDCPNLQAVSSKNGWEDSPHALTEIRNSLVHPEHKKRGKFNDAIYEAWNLGLWYLEQSILALCNYSGTYANRLKHHWVGQVENVSWAPGEAS